MPKWSMIYIVHEKLKVDGRLRPVSGQIEGRVSKYWDLRSKNSLSWKWRNSLCLDVSNWGQLNELVSSRNWSANTGREVYPVHLRGSLYCKIPSFFDFRTWMSLSLLPMGCLLWITLKVNIWLMIGWIAVTACFLPYMQLSLRMKLLFLSRRDICGSKIIYFSL